MSTEPLYIDLLITDGDFTLDSGNEPRRCDNRDSITQTLFTAFWKAVSPPA